MRRLVRYSPLLIGIGCGSPKESQTDSGGAGASSIDVIGILITPDELIVPVGSTVQLEATGLSAERSSVDLTDAVEWRSDSSAVAGVSNSLEEEGLLSGMSGGVSTIVAVFEGIESVPARVTVTDAELSSLSISPPSVIVGLGESIQLTAEARFSDGASADASSQVRWITGDAGVVTLESGGVLSAEGGGTTSVYVEWAGVESDPIEVEVVGSGSSGDVDLSIADVYATTDGSGSLSAWVEVENLGDGTAAAFWVDMWIDPESTPSFGDWPDAYSECEYVGPGSTATVLLQGYTSGAGEHDLFLVVDSTDDISETSESNNTAWADTSTGGGGTGDPNLVLSYFGGYSDLEEEVTYYWVDVTNETTADSVGFYVDVYHNTYDEPAIGTTGDEYVRVTELGGGQTEYIELIYEGTCAGCESWTLIDSFDEVDESNEDDNTGSYDVATL